MKKIVLGAMLLSTLLGCGVQKEVSNKNIVTTDIDNFWDAYDNITATKDTAAQKQYLNKLFIDKGSEGLHSMIQARNYTAKEYLNAINKYPKFWTSIRKDTYRAKTVSNELELGVSKLKILYPALKPAKIYFTVGALRSNGNTLENSILIGSELAFTNKNTPVDELPEYLSHLSSFFQSEPSKNIVFLNVHEYVHTQQKTTIGEILLGQTVIEGAAEFVAELALNTQSPNPQIQFGRENEERIKAKYELEMFSPNLYNWIWNSAKNEFGMRDLAYFIGYRICESYYTGSNNKPEAIKQMIELDYNDETALITFVEKSGYFSKPLKEYKEPFEKSRPSVVGLEGIKNNSTTVSTTLEVLTITFSEAMNTEVRNFELGPLGEDNLIRLKDFRGFSEDKLSVSFGIEKLEPNKKYQIIVGSGFRNITGVPLRPYLIEFVTTGE